MALPIIKGTDPIEIKQVKILVYGQPGAGKSSLGFTTLYPLCLDFDKGAYRSEYRKDIVDISKWSDTAKITAEDLKPYNTIIIDTLGRCLDYLTLDIINNDAKMSRKDGALTMQGYGALKTRFTKWVTSLTLLGKDVVMIAHDKEDKDGDNRIIRPDITGGSYNEIMKLIDFVGYCYIDNEKRILNFNPTEKTIGKNSAGFKPLIIPNFKEEPDYMTKLIATMKSSLGKSANSQLSTESVVKSYKEKIDALLDVEQFNTLLIDLRELHKAGKKKEVEQIRALLDNKASSSNIEYIADKKAYVEKPKPEPVTALETVQSAVDDVDF